MNYRFTFPELYQFFGGYFYQGWPADYRWENSRPEFSAVVRHFKAVNPPLTVNKVRIELAELLSLPIDDVELDRVLTELGSNFDSAADDNLPSVWLARILAIIDESPTRAKVLRELR